MATNLALDPGLLDRALAVSDDNEKTKKAAVTKALKELIARREQKRLEELFGQLDWEPDYDYEAKGARAGESPRRHQRVVPRAAQSLQRTIRRSDCARVQPRGGRPGLLHGSGPARGRTGTDAAAQHGVTRDSLPGRAWSACSSATRTGALRSALGTRHATIFR